MSKTKEELLLAYKKTNKSKRPSIVQRAGFSTEADYLAYLMDEDTQGSPQAAALFKKRQPKPIIHNVHIVDISYSMKGGKIESAIEGINTEIAELKKDDTVDYLQTIVVFSRPCDIATVVNKVPIKDVTKFHTSVISGTALNQAVGETLVNLRANRDKDEKVLVKIFTDGRENSSIGEFRDYDILSSLIKDCENEDFTITFIGTQRDVLNVINRMHIDASNTLSHDNTTRGVASAFGASVGATIMYAKKVKERKAVQKGFFKDIKK